MVLLSSIPVGVVPDATLSTCDYEERTWTGLVPAQFRGTITGKTIWNHMLNLSGSDTPPRGMKDSMQNKYIAFST